MAEPFRLYSTLSRTVEPFEPLTPGAVNLYVCGMTVYDRPHVGHARAMVTFDMVVRYLEHRGWKVTFVRNFTDVDDKIIARAQEQNEDPVALAGRYIDAFHEDCEGLGLRPPDAEPKVSESIDAILAMIGRLVERGHAYPADGSVWFEVATFDGYGKLSGQQRDATQSSGATGSDGKRAAEDFALWKGAKEGEPSWDSPFGPGRPGWHIECSAMSAEAFGPSFDIHGGGLDLVFPHHENEIAQSECAHGKQPYARYWMHNGLLTMDSGQKMGKSLGNAFNVQDALTQFPAEAIRLYYLKVHYRSPLPWSVDALPHALGLLSRLYEAREVAEGMRGEEPTETVADALGADAKQALELARAFKKRFYAAMDDDFNTGKALGIALELARATNRFSNHKKANKRGGPIAREVLDAFSLLPDALGLLGQTTEEFQAEVKKKRLPGLGLTQSQVEEALTARTAARSAKDFARGDAIRDELEQNGIVIMDIPGGTQWRIRMQQEEDAAVDAETAEAPGQ